MSPRNAATALSLALAAALVPADPPVLAGQDEPPGAAVTESDVCANCHSSSAAASAMRDAAGRSVAPHDLWRSTMMANSARDPFWRAQVAAEVAATPSRRAEIESECLSCHAPMADLVGLEEHGTGSLMHVLECGERVGELARDGVSCSVCHGISPEGLGTPESYSAGFVLDEHRRLFGPHAAPFEMPMRNFTGFTPTEGAHVTSSALCGSCHTLFTDALRPDGSHVGARLLEQAPYLEWRNSAFDDERDRPGPHAASCQDCHMPTSDADGRPIRTRLARNPMGFDFPPVGERAPFGRHLLVGGNVLMLSILADNAAKLGVRAPREAFEATIAATREQLAERTARIAVGSVERTPGRLAFTVEVENRTGHKLPTAHPSRRVWLRAIVRDGEGRVVFASGATDEAGRIVDGAGEVLASELAGGPIPPHRDVVRAADEVAAYFATMADEDGAPTHVLLRGATWLRDDRLLPLGWSADHPEAALTAPVGTGDDPDFVPGGDAVRYELAVPDGPLEVEVALVHQSVSARWAAELFRWEAPEIEVFRRMLEAADRAPEELARASLRVP